jgi:hypothetical protein
MKDSLKPLVDVKVDIPEDLLAKMEKIAEEEQIPIEDVVLFLTEVDSHQ